MVPHLGRQGLPTLTRRRRRPLTHPSLPPLPSLSPTRREPRDPRRSMEERRLVPGCEPAPQRGLEELLGRFGLEGRLGPGEGRDRGWSGVVGGEGGDGGDGEGKGGRGDGGGGGGRGASASGLWGGRERREDRGGDGRCDGRLSRTRRVCLAVRHDGGRVLGQCGDRRGRHVRRRVGLPARPIVLVTLVLPVLDGLGFAVRDGRDSGRRPSRLELGHLARLLLRARRALALLSPRSVVLGVSGVLSVLDGVGWLD